MFEGQPQQEIDALMQVQPGIPAALSAPSSELDKQVLDAELGVLPIDDVTLRR